MFNKLKNFLLLIAISGGVILFVLLAPLMIWAATMLFAGGIAFALVAFIIFCVFQWFKDRRVTPTSD